MIAALCAAVVPQTGSPVQACHKALEAWTHPFQIDAQVQRAGQAIQEVAERRTNRDLVRGSVALAGVARAKEVSIRTRGLPFVGHTDVCVRRDTATLSLGWSF